MAAYTMLSIIACLCAPDGFLLAAFALLSCPSLSFYHIRAQRSFEVKEQRPCHSTCVAFQTSHSRNSHSLSYLADSLPRNGYPQVSRSLVSWPCIVLSRQKKGSSTIGYLQAKRRDVNVQYDTKCQPIALNQQLRYFNFESGICQRSRSPL